jgi:hypothetical protein
MAMSQDTEKSTVDTAYWRQYVEKALGQRLARAGIESRPATGTGPNEVHTAFRIDDKAIQSKQVELYYVLPAAECLIRDIQKTGSKRVTMLIEVQEVSGRPAVAVRIFPEE